MSNHAQFTTKEILKFLQSLPQDTINAVIMAIISDDKIKQANKK